MRNPERRESSQDGSSEGARSGQQNQNSRQSMANASGGQQGGGSNGGRAREGSAEQAGQQQQTGIGASQGQDRDSPDLEKRPGERSNTSADIERAGQGNSRDSLVNDPTGAFKERP
jgi:hypothetical protein